MRARSLFVPQRKTALERALAACRSAFWIVLAFSLIINLLMLTQPIYMIQVYDRVLTTSRSDTLLLLTAMAAAALALLGALDALRAAVTVRIGCWLNERLGPVLIANGIRGRLQGDAAGGQSLRDLSTIQSFIGAQGLTVLTDAPWVPVFVALIWFLHPMLGMVALGSAVILLALSVANELLTRRLTVSANLAQISATQQAETTIRNAEVVQAMGMLPAMVDRWRDVNSVAQDAQRQTAERGGVLVGITKSLRLVVQVGILGLGAHLVIGGELTPGGMIAGSILLGRALGPVELAMASWRSWTAARIAYDQLQVRLRNDPVEEARIRLPEPEGRISVENLVYIPPGEVRPILRRVTFVVEPGEAVAVVGPSAAGKSTLCRMIVGIGTPSSGRIRLDGSELSHWEPEELGRYIGYLPQDVELFAGTVRENIARMTRGNDAAVVEAARLAHAHDMIKLLSQGYNTPIGELGGRLSAGQRQRIGLARAVYGNPRLIVLDEPNANLDQAGESALAAAIAELKRRGAAIVIVGHRPSTLAQVDKMLLLKDGHVEVFGPRDEVLQKLREAAAARGNPPAVPIQGVGATEALGPAATARRGAGEK